MGIAAVGLNHKTAPVELREQLAIGPEQLGEALTSLKAALPSAEIVILSTCNRVEVYISSSEDPDCGAVEQFLADYHGIERERFDPFLYTYAEREAVHHLFLVTSSLDSMVVGEAEILGQVKEAYLTALEQGTTGKILNSLFQKAFSVAKDVRADTRIGAGRMSVSSVAVEFAEKVFQDFSDKTAAVIGAGETSELTLKHLMSRGAVRVVVFNRTYARAVELAERYHGVAVEFDRLFERLHEADIVISSTASPDYIILSDHMSKILKQRRNKPIFLVDIAVPRDIDPSVNDLDNVYLYNIDDLQEIVSQNIDVRQKEFARCLEMVEEETDEFLRWMRTFDIVPTIKLLTEEFHDIRKAELKRLAGKISELSDDQKREVEYATERIVNKILNRPIQALRKEARGRDAYRYIEAVKRLFGLEDERD